jgi:iron complex outermembrane receptor protein
MLKGEIVYDDGGITARVGADYMSKRFFTYTNDQSVPDRLLLDASIGYKFGDLGFLKGFGIEGSVTNLTDKKYVSTIGSNGYGASGDNQTLLAGAPRQFFVTVRGGFCPRGVAEPLSRGTATPCSQKPRVESYASARITTPHRARAAA